MNDFLQNALAFNCALIVFKSLIWVRCQPHGFHGNNNIAETAVCIKIRMCLTEEDQTLIKIFNIIMLQCQKVNKEISHKGLKEDKTEQFFKAAERHWFGGGQ